jgi:hypothetical protein
LIVGKTTTGKRRIMLGELRKWRKRREENKTMIFFVAEKENKIRKVRKTTAKVDKVDKMKQSLQTFTLNEM